MSREPPLKQRIPTFAIAVHAIVVISINTSQVRDLRGTAVRGAMVCVRNIRFVCRRTFECGRLLKNPVLADMLGCRKKEDEQSHRIQGLRAAAPYSGEGLILASLSVEIYWSTAPRRGVNPRCRLWRRRPDQQLHKVTRTSCFSHMHLNYILPFINSFLTLFPSKRYQIDFYKKNDYLNLWLKNRQPCRGSRKEKIPNGERVV